MNVCEFSAWWAKSVQPPSDLAQCCAYHMIDVAAVAEVLLRNHPAEPAFRRALVLLVALHDVGKISDSFQRMLREGVPQQYRHWELTEALLYLNDDLLADALGNEPRRRQVLYGAVAGHHGRPSDLDLGRLPARRPERTDLPRAMSCIGSGAEPPAAYRGALRALARCHA